MKKTEVTCDQCGADLTYTGNCEDFRIVLGNEGVPIAPGIGAVTAMAICPPLKGTSHFCGVNCLGKWVSDTFPDAAAGYDKQMRRREQLAERMAATK